MSRTLTEQKVLRKLDIPDFRHLTKDKVVSFVSMLPQMDPEVAKLALEQFPAFAETNLAVIGCLKESMDTAISGNAENMAEFNARCKQALEALEAELQRENLTDEGRKMVIDGMMDIIHATSQKDSENKEYHREVFREFALVCIFAIVCIGAPLGLKMTKSMGN